MVTSGGTVLHVHAAFKAGRHKALGALQYIGGLCIAAVAVVWRVGAAARLSLHRSALVLLHSLRTLSCTDR